MKSFLPKITGEATLRPGRSVFHFTFSVGLKMVGRPFSRETPAPSGPRNCGQLAAATPATRSAVASESRMLMRGRVRSGFDGTGRCRRGLLLGCDHLDWGGPAGRVAHAGHEVPDLSEGLLLIVLARFHEQLVLAGVESDGHAILVEPAPVVVLLAGEHLCPIHEHLHRS